MSESSPAGEPSSGSDPSDKDSSVPGYQREEYLRREWQGKKRKLKEIAAEWGVSKSAVGYFTKKYDLEKPDRKYHFNCKHCGEEHSIYQTAKDRGEGVFCSLECKHAHYRDEVECANCGETWDRAHHAIDRSEKDFCSMECQGEWLSEHNTGENNPCWKENTAPKRIYNTKRWHRTRQEALERVGYQCEVCSTEENLLGHHIMPLSDGGAPFDVDNVCILCRSCHNRWEGWYIRPTRADE